MRSWMCGWGCLAMCLSAFMFWLCVYCTNLCEVHTLVKSINVLKDTWPTLPHCDPHPEVFVWKLKKESLTSSNLTVFTSAQLLIRSVEQVCLSVCFGKLRRFSDSNQKRHRGRGFQTVFDHPAITLPEAYLRLWWPQVTTWVTN